MATDPRSSSIPLVNKDNINQENDEASDTASVSLFLIVALFLCNSLAGKLSGFSNKSRLYVKQIYAAFVAENVHHLTFADLTNSRVWLLSLYYM